ncbi:response regulator transcription factor [Peptoniphilus sp. GNH]|nr:putative alkaline phosphatase synthesis transcriptional regulatory protein PhoP [Clostridiales bacterium KA00134]UHR03173.1 response regulator transcription factor [Peptoniphilus sp. GNH]
MTKILLVEDEEPIRKFVKLNLEREGYEVFQAGSGEEGLELAYKEFPDIVVLDVMLPGIDGFEVCKRLREKFPSLGIIMLTAKSEDYDKILGLQYGTDDYMSKPFNPTELTLRIRSLERRILGSESTTGAIIIHPPFKLDAYSRKFYKDDKEIDLTPTEYLIIKNFMENSGKALSRDEILNLVWGNEFVGDTKIVDVNIRRLRSKIEKSAAKPEYIETVWGLGYRWNGKNS